MKEDISPNFTSEPRQVYITDERLQCPMALEIGKQCINRSDTRYKLSAYIHDLRAQIYVFTCKDCFDANMHKMS